MEDKTPKTNAETFVEALTDALLNAKKAGGSLVNASGKAAPVIAPKMQPIMPFNALLIALASDKAGYKTNAVMPYMEAKKQGVSVMHGNKGVPFMWYSHNEYQNTENAEDKISRTDYLALADDEKAKYQAVPKREVSRVFNIDQTTMSVVDKEAYADIVKNYGAAEGEKDVIARDKATRITFNNYVKAIKENLVPIRKDAEKTSEGKAVYDPRKDVIHLPAQSAFPSYGEYVQEANRLLITATGSTERYGRTGATNSKGVYEGMLNRERLIVELASAVKNLQFGLEAKLSKESLPLVDGWVKSLREKPERVNSIEKEVNRSIAMLNSAANGKKFTLKSDLLLKDLQKENEVKTNLYEGVDKFKYLMGVKDDQGKDVNVFYIQPKGQEGFAVVPEKKDVELYFSALKKTTAELDATKLALANKYGLAEEGAYNRVDIFNDSPKAKNRVTSAQVFKHKDGKYSISAVIDGEKRTHQLTATQASIFFLAKDKKDYAKGLAVKLFPQYVYKTKEAAENARKEAQDKRVKQAEETKAKKAQANSPQKKEQERKEAKQREEFRKNVILPAIAAFVVAKANNNALQIVSQHGNMVAVGDNAKKLSEALSIPVEEVKDGNGVSTKVAVFAEEDLEKNTQALKEMGIDIDIINPEKQSEEKVEVRQQTTETAEETQTITTQTTIDEGSGEVLSQQEEEESEDNDLSEEEDIDEDETRSVGRGR